ncbi:MAG TPA: S9 family peptidase [Salinimicrobium sp.]|nr:S9 family peptidase [Salinimicrobium sp.]
MFKNVFVLVFTGLIFHTAAAQQSELSVEKIMQDPSWMGTFPSDITWGEHSENIYFDYNLAGDPEDSLYKISLESPEKILKVSLEEQQEMIPEYGDYNSDRSKKLYTRDGALVIYDRDSREEKVLLELGENINNPIFLNDEDRIAFSIENNAYIYNLENGSLDKLTNFHSGKEEKDKEKELSDQDKWLKEENLDLLQVVREREEEEKAEEEYYEMTGEDQAFAFYSGDRRISNIRVAPNGNFVTFNLYTRAENERTNVPDYVDASGYTTDIPARSKVGGEETQVEMAIYSLEQDSVYFVNTSGLPGITDLPDYVKYYPEKQWEEKVREVITSGPFFSPDGDQAVINIRSHDNKDRWISLLNLESGELQTLDRQRDEAWIAGPGIGWKFGGGTLGWLPDNEHIYFQSEESGYSHLYLLNVDSGKKKQLTSGEYEVFDPFLSHDGKTWYFTSSKVHPGERHFYKMPVMGGKMVQLTNMTGNNRVNLSPDEEHMAILHSFSNKPWELYLKQTDPQAVSVQLTDGQSEAFSSYDWRIPELVKFEAEDGTMVPARLFKPTEEAKNDAAIVFVHGAGYLQNAHKWWSSYFREYMFHNLLTDLGYTVLDIDYRGSAGYGRDWRTAIYRNMGGKDLSDQIDGAQYLVEEHGIDPEKLGIYGGSYGGFITLMAMFTEPGVFESGAALRSVTDWAHYNDGYTSNILNEPFEDPKAYRRSSPIYYAEGLEGNLLIAHGMLDTNVHFQDVVRLAQRLIELGKDDWEMAVYPVEGHGFIEPSSWTDEYSRILELFNSTLLNKN